MKAVNESRGPQTSMAEINSQQGIKVDQDEPSKCSLLKAVDELSGPQTSMAVVGNKHRHGIKLYQA